MKISKGIFFTTEDLMRLTGISSKSSSRRKMRKIKKEMQKENTDITIREYCVFNQLDYEFIWKLLRE